MSVRLIKEVNMAIARVRPTHVSFVGHSLGTIIVRQALADEEFRNGFSTTIHAHPDRPLLHMFLSLCGPHLGSLNLSSSISAGTFAISFY
jgi:hypothetical protein